MLAYLFSRFPVVSQTFCDTEMLALEAAGRSLVIGSLNRPPDSFRHERLSRLKAEVLYPPPNAVLDLPLTHPPDDSVWQAMAALAKAHEARYGTSYKPEVRARNAWHFAREFRKRGVSHLHIHFANRATHTALFLKKAGFTFSFTAHAQDFMVDLGNDDLLREMIAEATFTAAVSDYSRQLLTRIAPDSASKIHRVYNGIDPAQFPKSAAQASVSPRFRLISIGRLIDFKGFPVLLQSVALLRDNQIPVELRIIGEGPQRPVLEALIDRLQLQDEVRLPGTLSQDEIKKELEASDAFALACLTDTKGATDILPTVILEAMACGLPVVSTTLAGVPEMVLHSQTGLLAPPDDAPALAAHLTTLARDPALRTRLGQAGLRHVKETFSLEKTAGHLSSLFPPDRSTASKQGAAESATPQPLHRPHPSYGPYRSHPDPFAHDSQTLALLDSPSPPDPALLQELTLLTTEPALSPRITLLATRRTPPILPSCESPLSAPPSKSPAPPCTPGWSQLPANLEYLPDATVLEAAWRSHPHLAAKAESLRSDAGPVDSELFYMTARRAVHLATQAPLRRWTRIHALRANTVLLAWLLHRLTRVPASATIEAAHHESRSLLAGILPAFTAGSNSDPKLKSPLPDLLQLRLPPPKKRLLGLKLSSPPIPLPDPAPVWRNWLNVEK